MPRSQTPRRITPREQQVLYLIATGAQDKEIAHTLSISVNTVRHHLENATIKLNATSRANTVALWLISSWQGD